MGEGERDGDEMSDGVRLHHYTAFSQLTLDGGKGGDWAEHGMIEAFANIANTITLIVEGDGEDQDHCENGYGHACVMLTVAEARWLGKKLIADADTAEQQAGARKALAGA